MNYKKIHDEIILRAKTRCFVSGYSESHHIVPKSMGGTNCQENIVVLTAREHYLIHWLLFKIYRNKQMAFAWYRMTHGKLSVNRYSSYSFLYARLARAKAVSEMCLGKKLSPEHRQKLSEAKKGKTYSDLGRRESPLRGRSPSKETREKISAKSKGRRHSEETRKKLSAAKSGEKNHRFGKEVSEETRAKLSVAVRESKAKLKALKNGTP